MTLDCCVINRHFGHYCCWTILAYLPPSASLHSSQACTGVVRYSATLHWLHWATKEKVHVMTVTITLQCRVRGNRSSATLFTLGSGREKCCPGNSVNMDMCRQIAFLCSLCGERGIILSEWLVALWTDGNHTLYALRVTSAFCSLGGSWWNWNWSALCYRVFKSVYMRLLYMHQGVMVLTNDLVSDSMYTP